MIDRYRCLLWAALMTGLLFSSPVPAQEKPRSGPERWEPDIQRFEAADAKSPPAPGQVVFVGSSSIRMWKLQESFPGLDALNRGFGGSILPDSVHYFDRIVAAYKPRLIVLYAGDNDVNAKHSPEAIAADFEAFLKKAHAALPRTRVIYIGIKPSIKRWNLVDQVRAANKLIQAVCKNDPFADFIDVDAVMLGADGKPNPDLFAPDGLHMSPAGYKIWADLLRPFLSKDPRVGALRTLKDKYHPWTPPATLAEWEALAPRLRRQIQMASGLWPLPEKGPLEPKQHGTLDRGDYIVERISFTSMPGLTVTGNLYRPKNIQGRVPGILCTHGHTLHGRFQDNGDQTAQRWMNMGAEQFYSGARMALQARSVQMARMGCVVFHYDMIGNADSKTLSHRGGFSDADASLWLHSKLGLQTWNSLRCVDYLLSRDDVDPTRIAINGGSGGGTQTMLAGALDSRIAQAFPAVMVSTNMQGGCICENADYLRIGINNVAIAALFAPRPQGMSGANDWTINIETLGLPELKQVYGLYGQADQVSARCWPQFPHSFNQPSREYLYELLNRDLQLNLPTPVRQTDFWPLTREELSIDGDQPVSSLHDLPENELRDRLRERDRAMFQALLKSSDQDYRTVIGGALQVMLSPDQQTASKTDVQTQKLTENIVKQTFLATTETQQIPGCLLTPDGEVQGLALWFDPAGTGHLFNAQGLPEKAVQQLLDQHWAVASADLYLTGPEADSQNRYVQRFHQITTSHEPSTPGEDYSGFVYGYNRPLISERVSDIQHITEALNLKNYKAVAWIGTGEAGLWTILSRAAQADSSQADGPLEKTIVVLNAFRFSELTSAADPDFLPGALKYGGIGGLAGLISPAPLQLYVSAGGEEELAPLSARYGEKSGLTIQQDQLKRAAIPGLVAAP
jgi:lysophospholipase L1-like esterase